MNRSQRRSDFDLLRTVYRNTQTADGGRIAYSKLTHGEIIESGCTAADIDDQVSVPRSVEGIQLAALFTEGRPGKIRINLRGERGLNVLELAQKIGGGGHNQAAGAILKGQLEDVVTRVLAEATEYLNNREDCPD
jgi:phosphoesterase RecJ-like protein